MSTFEWQARTEALLGHIACEKLRCSRAAVFGCGGVGSAAAEGLARSGFGFLCVIDRDTVSDTNRNRQLLATAETVGKEKAAVQKERILSIAPETDVLALCEDVTAENIGRIFDLSSPDVVIDCVDTVSAKLAIIAEADRRGIPCLSSMGTGNKLDPTRFRVDDITKTSVCPLARVMRRELKNRGIAHLRVLWSDEIPTAPVSAPEAEASGRIPPASAPWVPPVAGLILAGEAARTLISSR